MEMLTRPQSQDNEFLKGFEEFKSTHDYEDRLFATYVSENPLAASRYALSIPSHRREDQDEFFSAIRGAINETQELDWKSMLGLIEYMIVNNKSEHLLHAFDTLARGLEYNIIDPSFKEQIWQLIQKMLLVTDEQPSHNNNFDPDVGSLTYSISDVGGVSFHALFRYMEWCTSNENSNDVFHKNIKPILDDYQNNPSKYTISKHGAIGFFFRSLFSVDKQYALNLFHNISSKSYESKIYFWSSYVWVSPLDKILFELRSIYDELLNGTETDKIRNTMLYRNTIEHVTSGYLYDVDGFDEIFWRFVHNADEASIDSCSLFIFARLRNKDVDKFIDKVHTLWRERKFIRSRHTESWFLHSPIDKASIDSYINYLKTRPKGFVQVYFPAKILYKYANKFPLEVARCMDVFLDKFFYSYPSDIKQILSILSKTDNSEINEICNKIMIKTP